MFTNSLKMIVALLVGVVAAGAWGIEGRAEEPGVVKAAEKHKVVKFKMTLIVDNMGMPRPTDDKTLMYADVKAPRCRREEKSNSFGVIDVDWLLILDGKKKLGLNVLTEKIADGVKEDDEKLALAKKEGCPRKDAKLFRLKEEYADDPIKHSRPLLEVFQELEKHKDAVVTKEKLDGKEAVKYYREDGKKTYQLWVDAKTKLPLQYQWENLDPKITWVFSDFEWDPKLPTGFKDLDALFDTTPPKGYKLDDLTKKDNK
jgi:hypothetical protein